MTQLLNRKSVILAKVETVYGTDVVPTGALNAILIRNLSMTPLQVNQVGRDVIRPYLGNSENLPTSESVRIEFEVEMAGSGAAGTAPKWGPLMQMCAMSETVSAGVSVVYQPVSTAFKSGSIYFNLDGRRHKLTGARGSFSCRLGIDQIPVFAFTFTGLYNAPTDSTETGVVFTGFQTPAVVTNANTTGLSFHGYSGGIMADLSVDLANDVQFRPAVGQTSSVIITDRKPSGSITLDSDLVAAWDPWTKIRTAALSTMSITQGTVAGNKVKIDAPKVQMSSVTMGERTGIATEQFGLVLVPNTGDDELIITAL